MIPEYTAACPEGALQRELTVTREQTDASGQMRPGDLAREMEKITEEHLGMFGMNRASLREEGKIWVISWTSVSIERLPREGEKVILRVWPGKKKAVMYPRKYAFYSAEGEPLAGASSLFILMDENTRSAAMPTEKMKQIPAVTIPGEPDLPPMRVMFPETMTGSVLRTVQPEEIDKNGHLNNTHYLDWAMDLAGEFFPSGKTPGYIWVEYTKELLEGQEARLHYGVQGDSFYIKGTAEGEKSFSVRMDGII